ncbi:hypothetical protein [Planctomicrobium piriforme]|uniref:Uncharacterized protein n=1 Tax=Planctomicrobium piriforme TaxID=1576369 RepID=A0A1I3GW72_9PLAN|nr:hypothetical protein [Planctomicrobium piriforme]SFI27815.1 hypothetical protein SAMN05421753_107156 [Planctomicrobium piriforme]
MKKLLALALVLGAATTTLARQPMLAPELSGPQTHTAQYSPNPTPAIPVPPSPGIIDAPSTGAIVMSPVPDANMQPGVIMGEAIAAPVFPLYRNVKYVQERNIAPCAVKKIVSVPDPCNPCSCVFVCICVPPCACEDVYCSPHKDRMVFDYGEYKVNITERRGTLVVNYDD